MFTDVWKEFGFGTIVYLAAITNIDPTQYEAATIDGANRFQRIMHVTLPNMRMIIVLMMVLPPWLQKVNLICQIQMRLLL